MVCKVCGGLPANIGQNGELVLVHEEVGQCWEPYFHAYKHRGRDPVIMRIHRIFNPAKGRKQEVEE